ncbi:MAG: non-heme iron oxygenase ferredoxin subunit [Dehalococcoidia bacterium]
MSEFRPVAKVKELHDESALRVEVDGFPIALVKSEGTLYACQDTCTHEEASLSDGDVFNGLIECPLHGARFDLRTGAVRSLPAVIPLQVFEVTVEGDDILVKV